MFTWVCPQCGREVPPSYTECPDCAKKAKAAPPQPPPPQPQQPYPPQGPPQYYPPQQQYAPPQQQYPPPPQPQQPPQQSQPPQQYAPPQQPQWGAPPPPQQQYAPPQEQQWAPPPPPPPQQQYAPRQDQQWGPPPPPQQQYAPPQEQQWAPPPPQQQYAPPQDQQWAPPPQQQQWSAAPPQQQQYAPPSPPPPTQEQYTPPPPEQTQVFGAPEGRRLHLPVWLLTVIFAVGVGAVVGGVVWLFGSSKPQQAGSGPAPTAAVESPAAKPGAKQNPLQKYIEVSGVRFVQDAKKATQVRFVLINHSEADISGLAGNVTIWGRTRKSEEDAQGTFSFTTNLGPFESKEMTVPLNTKLKIYELPDWQNVTTDVQITAPAGA
ncbi:MAG TPA: hypothetical protein VMJ75_17310 [Candidatus Acidoferrales bacterium]|nr:hypothetical protein [Candidatus Acidoferrales bacterium]